MRVHALSLAFALSAASCGGLSEHHDATDAGAASDTPAAPATDGSNGDGPAAEGKSSPADDQAACVDVCGRCLAGGREGNCAVFCSNLLSDAAEARCSAAFESLLRCRRKSADACAADACPTEDNAFTACIIEYCDSHFMSDACTAPL